MTLGRILELVNKARSELDGCELGCRPEIAGAKLCRSCTAFQALDVAACELEAYAVDLGDALQGMIDDLGTRS